MSKRTLILLGFIILKFLLQHFLISPEYDLQRDEYLHLDQGHHLAWGYESVPPFTSWISWIIFQLGNSVFWVKFFPSLFGALTILVVWKTIEVLNGNLFALIMGATAATFSVLLRINILYQPNSFDILSWTLFYYTFICYIKTEKIKWLYFAAIVFAIGFLNKYNIAFLLIGLVPAILLTEQRKLLLNKHVYFAMIVSLLLISPNLIWQYQNNFAVLRHMKELAETQLVNVQRSDFLKEQLLFFFNSIFVLVIALIGFFIYPPFKKYRLFFWSLIFTLIVFTYFKAKGYYAIGLYPILLAFGAVYLEYLTSNGWKKWFRPICILVSLLIFLPAIKKIFPVESPEEIVKDSKGKTHRWEDGKEHILQQDFADMLGWRELAARTDSIYKTLPDKEHTIVLCANYGEAGAINFYTKEKIQAVSINADYINWFHLDKKILSAILVKDDSKENVDHEKTLFESVILRGTIENEFAREKGTRIFLLSGPKTDINKVIEEEINKKNR
ncbi:MAG: glycosyltransferase family 39 protein [Ferruginibacter sp.]